MSIAFIDLKAQRVRIKDKIENAVMNAIESGAYIMGPNVREFEDQLSAFTGAARTITCGNGTDAIALVLMAWDVGPGDAIFCPSFTFAATSEPAPMLGASPVFVDIRPDSFNMDPESLEKAIQAVKAEGKLKPKAVIAVDLFGQSADYPAIAEICKKHDLKLMSDSAQGFGCTLNGKHPHHWADAQTASFFPAKPLGCYGDGGAVQTNDPALGDILDSLRFHGKASQRDMEERHFDHHPKYLNVRTGLNSRLDAIQAAILKEKLAIYPDEIEKRNAVAKRYNEGLEGVVPSTPHVIDGAVSVWAQYTVQVENREALAAQLKEAGVPTNVYYPIPLHCQPVNAPFTRNDIDLSVSEEKAERVISLPMHPYLDEASQDTIISAIRKYYRG